MRKTLAPIAISLFLLSSFSSARAEAPAPAGTPEPSWSDEFAQLSIDQLVNLKVTSASRKSEKLSDVASAIYVLTEEDIRRSGATTIPDALRMVPGLNVAQIDGSQWAISARGFNGVFGDKLLVLIDGRTVYTPLFAGVFWNEQDTVLEDVERIEVIRGPGATLWGSNAVNGVINIITKNAEKTQGLLATTGGGTREQAFGSLRYGDKVGDTDYRVFAKAFSRSADDLQTGDGAHDGWDGYRAGFRTDTRPTDRDLITIQGESHYNEAGWDLIRPTLDTFSTMESQTRYINGQNILGRWTRQLGEKSDFSVQTYFDRVDRDDQVLKQQRNTFDIDAQYRFSPHARHDLLVGTGYRVYHDDHQGSFSVDVDPASRTLSLGTAFIQDEFTVIPNRLKFIFGTKLEENQLSGFEVLPNFRVVTTPNENNTFWGAVSRAVRNPARFNKDGRLVLTSFPGEQGLPTIVSLSGNSDFDSEEMLAYELGYRTHISESISIDLTGFYNDYNRLESAEPSGTPFLNAIDGQPVIEVPFNVQNKLEGRTYGGEVAVDWRPYESWRLVGTYSHFNINLDRKGDSQDTIFSAGEGQTSKNQFMLRSLVQLPHNTEFDAMLRYVSSIDTFDINAYWAVDARVGWHASQNLEFSVVGQNLFDPGHVEFTSNLVDTQKTEIPRGVYGKITYRF